MKKADVLMKIQLFENALNKLKESVNECKTELERDGVIQRFEFTVELFWKTLKAILEYQGVECFSPRNCIKEAFKANIIEDDEIFLDMLEDRSLSSHIYDERTAKEIFNRIKNVYVKVLGKLNLREKI